MTTTPDNVDWGRLKADVRRAADCVGVYSRVHPDPAGDIQDGGTVRCIDPNHEDRNPSMSLHADGFKCHACGASGDVFALQALACRRSPDGEDFKRTVLELAVDCGLDPDNYTPNGTPVDIEVSTTPLKRASTPAVSDVSPTRTRTTDPPDVRRKVFARIWHEVRPRPLTDAARRWLTSRGISPFVAHAYGCRDWHPAIDAIRAVLRDYDAGELRRAGLLNDEGKAWWPLRTYIDPDRDPQRGLAVPVWHPDTPEAPIGVRWRVYEPGEDFPPKCFGQPCPGFVEPPLGLCEPAPAEQLTLGTSWFASHVDVDGAREWATDTTPRRLGDYPGAYTVVLCEGETDWLSVATAAVELESETRLVPVGLAAMAAPWADAWTGLLCGARRVVAMFDGTNRDPECNGRKRADEVYEQLVARHPEGADGVDGRFVYALQPEGNDLNDRRQAGQLTDYLRFNAVEAPNGT